MTTSNIPTADAVRRFLDANELEKYLPDPSNKLLSMLPFDLINLKTKLEQAFADLVKLRDSSKMSAQHLTNLGLLRSMDRYYADYNEWFMPVFDAKLLREVHDGVSAVASQFSLGSLDFSFDHILERSNRYPKATKA